ncbi:hypothetical protein PBI_MAHDIA_12 [Gordonia phage Mahdia]|uniref:Uncharacterized protein n=1 Tax=Gordonia phage Mahdia TaxID=2047873 RepID=A0A2H4P9U6_9CAUD|nr:hypothetical protein FDJ14_gp12 [Gordonia phage Mahdia]ATW59011.1 hypothetical protein PBI_MAHDIA_12 [Gordonia phage Mahdia]
MSKVTASAKAARENSLDGLVRVQFLKDHNGYAKGQTRRVDPRSAESLLKAKVVKRADEPDPVPEAPEVPDIPASKDLTPPE